MAACRAPLQPEQTGRCRPNSDEFLTFRHREDFADISPTDGATTAGVARLTL
jgi:hypothetical protein